jgi:hypothetical protein
MTISLTDPFKTRQQRNLASYNAQASTAAAVDRQADRAASEKAEQDLASRAAVAAEKQRLVDYPWGADPVWRDCESRYWRIFKAGCANRNELALLEKAGAGESKRAQWLREWIAQASANSSALRARQDRIEAAYRLAMAQKAAKQ